MVSFIVTGGTGFLGRRVVQGILDSEPDAQVHILVRAESLTKFESLDTRWRGSERVHPLVGDLTADGLGLSAPAPAADHIIHLGAVYDMTADEATAHAANVRGTNSVLALAKQLDAVLHHVSSVAVAGDHRGQFFEEDFDLGQRLTSPYHRTKFAAEKMVRESQGVRWRVYRPAIVVGDSRTGEMDKIDGPYYFFPAIAALGGLPAELPLPLPDLGATNVVPVDYVAAAMVELVRRPGLDGRTFHLVNPRPQPFGEIYGALAAAAGAPTGVGPLPGSRAALSGLAHLPGVPAVRDFLLERLGIPAAVAPHVSFSAQFVSDSTRALLRGLPVPEFDSYAGRLWEFWRANLDPDRHRPASAEEIFTGRIVLITGASSGIGLATAHAVARRGATVLMVARGRAELEAAAVAVRADGGDAHAYACDITDAEAVDSLVATILADHGGVDYLVNNAGRSIRRSVVNSTDRMHDFERTMAVNYFGAVRLILALLPSMRERRFGHIVNISSIAVQTKVPRFAAYVASKSALDNFSEIAAVENRDAGITFTSVRMPLVRTPMIAPTDLYRSLPVPDPAQAAAIVMRALVERPDRIDTPVGTFAQAVELLMPSVKRSIMHQGYRIFGESKAAAGMAPRPEGPGAATADQLAERPRSPLTALSPVLLPLMALPGPAARMARVVPGLHW
ncbi:SDR family oxidoreductase [Nocardia cyriacigeorgica]|uniref:Fatty acyl-CoA reductase n=1 Tax=Nocardia cyriacigeorgica TaxID=135487 RepID=A0A4V6IBX9_9NOCA|nr:SDR family oxidoreductase [Nocardia cyriacigeorgica]MBF6320026.1 SDR family oxidoreductase [Nocardia cyriacigeorgica]MBF6534444.1 SDR family oxidoreductase [Nocardia cyriacigeorgica]VFA97463.1 Fatty acyl-CoA reductase [Nocardia cyriacigeorgica]